jgi:spore maturation protein CgeB
MRVVLYTHSLVSDWNHGNAHFQRGILRELEARGHSTLALEPEDGWSRTELVKQEGTQAEQMFGRTFPELSAETYGPEFDHAAALNDADLVIVHEWTDPRLISKIGGLRRNSARFALLFNDTHHRAASSTAEIERLDLDGYDGVLAFGEALRETYLRHGWGRRAFTWHEAPDVRLFKPHPDIEPERDVVWIGNWGDGERKDELETFLFEPCRSLKLSGTAHGVRYPASALKALRAAGLDYRGWIPSSEVPVSFARHRLTVHVPRRPYTRSLPGIPTIRMFEALACGIPLISAPWTDSEHLFRPGKDFLFALDGEAMAGHMRDIMHDHDLAGALAKSGLETILSRHTCAHRVDELIDILRKIEMHPEAAPLENA